MSWLYIALIIIALICIIGSFFLSEKLSSSDIEEISKVSEKEIKIILDKELNKSSDTIKDNINERLDEAFDELERKTDKETNDKITHISEYSDTVLESMNNSHEEIKFMYSMLSDKQEKLKELESNVSNMQSNIKLLSKELDDKIEELSNMKAVSPTTISVVQAQSDYPSGIELASIKQEAEPEVTIADVLEEKIQTNNEKQPQTERGKVNQEIIDLYNEGLNEVDIAKRLGKGIGEVKLVLGLFK